MRLLVGPHFGLTLHPKAVVVTLVEGLMATGDKKSSYHFRELTRGNDLPDGTPGAIVVVRVCVNGCALLTTLLAAGSLL